MINTFDWNQIQSWLSNCEGILLLHYFFLGFEKPESNLTHSYRYLLHYISKDGYCQIILAKQTVLLLHFFINLGRKFLHRQMQCVPTIGSILTNT